MLLCFQGNNQNYIGGKLNIDQDELYVGGASTLNSSWTINGNLGIGTASSYNRLEVDGATNITGQTRKSPISNGNDNNNYIYEWNIRDLQ